MIFNQLQQRSPQQTKRRINSSEESLTSLSCHQMVEVSNQYEDFYYYFLKLSYVSICGYVCSVTKALSPKGLQMRLIKICDNTGYITVQLYSWLWFNITQRELIGNYIKVIVNIRMGGLAYKPQRQFNCLSWTIIKDFNEITSHHLETIRSYLKAN